LLQPSCGMKAGALKLTNAQNFAEPSQPHANILQSHRVDGQLVDQRPRLPIVAAQRRDRDGDKAAAHIWIEVTHRLFIQVDYAAGFQRSDVVYLHYGLLIET
jgi:hypothetical protein